MKVIFGDAEHKIYMGVKPRGLTTDVFAKCRCGLVMVGADAIDEHQAFILTEEKNFSEENNG